MLIIVPEQVPGYAKVGNQLQTTERGSPMDQVPGTQPPNTNPKDFGSKNLQTLPLFEVLFRCRSSGSCQSYSWSPSSCETISKQRPIEVLLSSRHSHSILFVLSPCRACWSAIAKI
uniref:Uncharacterized protein n=1 Tax=Ananas comosus var. bracteatus TaxID=296719 RepID=A0A6V7PZ15_ANACO|nr:unnamed protein product [Ananas comosus var. bracteatus]